MTGHGGKREGAGRKPSPSPLKPITTRLSQVDIDYLRTIDDKPSKAIRELIRRAQNMV